MRALLYFLLLWAAYGVGLSRADGPELTFMFKIGNEVCIVLVDGRFSVRLSFAFLQMVSKSLMECSSLKIIVIPKNDSTSFTGVPPYYLTAAEIGGVPTTTEIGSDPNNLSWRVNHRAGTLSVAQF
jgi:hypothetical protein